MNRATGITIGNFDGVHRGHAELVRATRSAVGADGRVVVLSFDPHPISVLRPDSTPSRLTPFERRRDLLIAAGADDVIALSPTKELLGQDAVDFIRSIVESESPAFIVEGPDFRFGKGRTGSIGTLREYESAFGYRTIIIDPVEAELRNQHIVRISSTVLRWLIAHGRVEDARLLLGRPYDLECPVVPGDKRGRTIGVPTANLDHGDLLLPGDGIYAGRAIVLNERQADVSPLQSGPAPGAVPATREVTTKPGTRPPRLAEGFPAAISVGTKPTFGKHPRVCEAHLIGYDGPLNHYGWTIRLEFHYWLRDQLVYRNLDSLVDQLHRDIDGTLDRMTSGPLAMGHNAAQPISTANRP